MVVVACVPLGMGQVVCINLHGGCVIADCELGWLGMGQVTPPAQAWMCSLQWAMWNALPFALLAHEGLL